jgi:hypothetical protein
MSFQLLAEMMIIGAASAPVIGLAVILLKG